MTVRELINKLSRYSDNTEIHNINQVVENSSTNISLYYKESPQEIKDRQRRIDEANREHREKMDRGGEITSFANRW